MKEKQIAYAEMLKDPRWQKRRLEIFERDQFTCQTCLNDRAQLHVHHDRYKKGIVPWDYGGEDLITLCDSCHHGITELGRGLAELLTKPDVYGLAMNLRNFAAEAKPEDRMNLGFVILAIRHSPEILEPIYKIASDELLKRMTRKL